MIDAGAWFSEPTKRGLRPEPGPAPAGEACFRAGHGFWWGQGAYENEHQRTSRAELLLFQSNNQIGPEPVRPGKPIAGVTGLLSEVTGKDYRLIRLGSRFPRKVGSDFSAKARPNLRKTAPISPQRIPFPRSLCGRLCGGLRGWVLFPRGKPQSSGRVEGRGTISPHVGTETPHDSKLRKLVAGRANRTRLTARCTTAGNGGSNQQQGTDP
jgi:hypothetical protein